MSSVYVVEAIASVHAPDIWIMASFDHTSSWETQAPVLLKKQFINIVVDAITASGKRVSRLSSWTSHKALNLGFWNTITVFIAPGEAETAVSGDGSTT